MNDRHLPLFMFLWILCIFPVIGQTLLFQKNRYRHVSYKEGDRITVQLTGPDKTKFSDIIKGFEDTLIVFKHYKISPGEISHIYVDEKTKVWFVLRYKYEKIFLMAGLGLLSLELLNNGAVGREILIISSSFIGAGVLAKLVISKKMKIKGKRRLIIVH